MSTSWQAVGLSRLVDIDRWFQLERKSIFRVPELRKVEVNRVKWAIYNLNHTI